MVPLFLFSHSPNVIIPQETMTIQDSDKPTPQQQEEEEPTRTSNCLQTLRQNASLPSSNVRALRIPEIVIEIGHYLTVSDLTACLSVCKLWSTIAQHHLWRSVFLYQKSEEFFVSLSLEQQAILRQNAHRIKTLGLVQYETVFVKGMEEVEEEDMEKEAMRCTHLEEIYFFGLVNKNVDLDEEHDNEQPSALDLIAQNPRLLRMHLFDIEVMTRFWTPTRLTRLRHHSSLQSITLMFSNYVYDIYIIRSIVTHCPDTLQELKITTFGGATLQSSAVRREYEDGDEDKEMGLWRVLPQMRDLAIDVSLHPCEESILFPLLKCCPNLTRLRLNTLYEEEMDTLMSVLLQAPFRKSVIHLELPNTLLTPAHGVQFMETFCGLTSLTMRITAGDAAVVARMIDCSGATLEHVRLIEGTASSRYVAGIDSILERCSRLRTLRVDGLGIASGTGVSMTRLLETNPWACSESLEELAFRIDSPRNEDFDQWSVGRGVLLVARLFERLKELPRLRRVRFVWGGGTNGLWTTILSETGVRALELSGRGMTMADVEWMGL